MKTPYIAACAAAVAFAALGNDKESPVSENVRGHENVEWSVAYAYGLTDSTKDLPRVLLVGDSICRGYQGGVRELLKGKMNVSYWISSYCVTSAAYLPLLAFYLDQAKYDVIHFNNGLHSLRTPTVSYEKGMRRALELIREKQPGAKLVWCSSTPLTNAVKTAKCRELNAAAAKVVAELGGIATDDLFSLLDPLDRAANWSDEYHHRGVVQKKESEQVAASVLSALNNPSFEGQKGGKPVGYMMEHTAIDVADPVATANWWVKNLGFEITSQRDDVTHTTFIVDRTGRIALELYRAKDAPEAPDYHAMRPLQLHFGFLSDDVDADIARLTAAGATLVVHEKAPGFDGAMMKDPSGISIQFVKRGKPVLKGCRR